MNSKKAIGKSFLTWCTHQGWDWFLVLTVPATTTTKEMGRNFRQWIREVEEADGTLSFRWIRFAPVKSIESSRESYVLVGGLSSGESWYWTRRWKAINRDPDSHAGAFYSSRRRKGIRLKRALEELLNDAMCDVQIQFGPRHIQRRRTLKVDEDGLPLDKKMLRTLRNLK